MYRRRYRRKTSSRRRSSLTGRKRKRLFKKGYDRVGGFYGRFGNKNKRSKTEKKFKDTEFVDTTLNAGMTFLTVTDMGGGTAGTTTTIVDIPQGTGQNQRIGRKCTITNILCTFSFSTKAGNSPDLNIASSTDESLRIMVVWDKQCNGAAFVASDILVDDKFNAYRNLSNQERFSILYDKTKSYFSGAIAAGPGPLATDVLARLVEKDYIQKINIKCFIPIEFNSTTGALTEIKSNNIAIVIWGKHGNRIDLDETHCRIRFIDL